jgi:hypothetical protein
MIEIICCQPEGDYKDLRLIYRESKTNLETEIDMLIPCAHIEDGNIFETRASEIFENNYLSDILEKHKEKYWDEDLINSYAKHALL